MNWLSHFTEIKETRNKKDSIMRLEIKCHIVLLINLLFKTFKVKLPIFYRYMF